MNAEWCVLQRSKINEVLWMLFQGIRSASSIFASVLRGKFMGTFIVGNDSVCNFAIRAKLSQRR
jgi:hypothetical protein